ncbi:MAG: hypothetical protein SPK27_02350 [Sodaliphilus sp.]|nr:hypothetical protein [Bacteroidales bacterium]MDY5867011.1 hypothetical protein [Sodaliphilus sp.]
MVSLLWADVKYHPYQKYWFFAEGERFLSFWRCHRPRGEGGVRGVVWLIQASA